MAEVTIKIYEALKKMAVKLTHNVAEQEDCISEGVLHILGEPSKNTESYLIRGAIYKMMKFLKRERGHLERKTIERGIPYTAYGNKLYWIYDRDTTDKGKKSNKRNYEEEE